jgi:ATP-dependent Lon protease
MTEPRILPVLCAPTVIFPGPPVTMAISGTDALRSVEAAMRDDHVLFVVAELTRQDEQSAASQLPNLGVIASVEQVQMGRAALQIVLTSQQRATALDYRPGKPLRALVLPTPEIPPPDIGDKTFQALLRETREQARELGRSRGIAEDVLQRVLDSEPDPGRLADLVANYLDIELREKQVLLETLPVEARLRRVLIAVQREVELVKTQQDIKDQVQQELGDRQRELVLREQLKAIRRELGEDAGDSRELEELRQKLAALQLPEEARTETDRELGRLGRIGSEALESQVIRTYLQWISELPWNSRSEDTLDLERAAQVLDEDHYGLKDVKDRVLEFLSVRILSARRAEPAQAAENGAGKEAEKARAIARGPITLFIGPPGVGKTSIAQSIARALGRKYVRVSLGGIRDEADIRGHRRTYVAALPGRIIQGLKRAGTKNPVFLLDEVDKLGASLQGDPSSALLEVLDPAQNSAFTDHYLGVAFDLSEVLFIATGNFMHQIPAPLLDRMDVIEFAGYTEREKLEIARRYLVPRQLGEAGMGEPELPLSFDPDALGVIISEYTRESGVRQLERQIGAVARKLARRLAGNEQTPSNIDASLVRELLGKPRVRPERAASENEIGVATGMYYTPSGGDIMFVEAAVRRRQQDGAPAGDARAAPGDVALILTGQLGDVMRESARAALSYVLNHARELEIPEDWQGALEAHLHVPAGSIPKDGPSAGVTMATALASTLSRRPVRKEVAMTGEITLRGHVLPIGGVKEKVLGAARAGITEIVLPEANAPDLADLPDDVRNSLRVHLVRSLRDVLAIALAPAPAPTEALVHRNAAEPNGESTERPGARP